VNYNGTNTTSGDISLTNNAPVTGLTILGIAQSAAATSPSITQVS